MNLYVAELDNGITKVSLSGRLDIDGALKIDNEFTAIAENKKRVLVDLADVTFIASLGIRTLISGCESRDEQWWQIGAFESATEC